MDERLMSKVGPIDRFARLNGWETDCSSGVFDGAEGVQLVGSRLDVVPGSGVEVCFGFSVAFAVNPDSGRVAALRFDGKPRAVLVLTVDDGSGRYWFGPLSAYRSALADPQTWTHLS